MKCVKLLLLLLCVTCVLSACDSWMDGSYYSVKPHLEEYESQLKDTVEVASYAQLQDVMVALVADGRQNGVIYMPDFQPTQLNDYMDRVVLHITGNNAIGAYAVDEILYDIGTHTGRTAIAVQISYVHSRSEILRIKRVQNMDDAMNVITEALEDCDAGTVIHVAEYTEKDLTQAVQDYVTEHPDRCMEMPQVVATVYPDKGPERVIEVAFTYQTSRETLRSMKDYVSPVFSAADLNVSGEELQSVKFALMYSFLMERNNYRIETSITPAYSLLRHGVGDSKAFATVYAAMCSRADLECWVVSGTKHGEPWVWNIICEDGIYYHVDLLRSSGVGNLEKLSAEQMQGYVWDYSTYPVSGTSADEMNEKE